MNRVIRVMRVVVVCEGETEEEFVGNVLAPAFTQLGLHLEAQLVQTSPGHRGGALNYDRVKRHLCHTLRQKNAPFVSTFFDLYKIDKRFPGFEQAMGKTDVGQKLEVLRRELHGDVVAAAQCRPERFIPHIQPYEFESLLFSEPAALAEVNPAWTQKSIDHLLHIRNQAVSPEHINDKPETKPAAHLQRELGNYRKRLHGPIAAQKIGLNKIEAECAFFAAWLAKIRTLAQPS